MPYLSEDIKKGFDKYQYNCRDTSPLAVYVMHPFWNWVSGFYPMWLAPNLLTLLGFLSLVINFLILTYFDMDFYASTKEHPRYAPIPSVVWLICGILNFLSHTLDGTDGKQARRTGSSSPVGEMFDHGCDSWATMFFPVCLYSVFGRGEFGGGPMLVLGLLYVIFANFFLTHWEKYITGVMYLPWAYDLSQNGMTLVYLITFALGAGFWCRYVITGVTLAVVVIIFVHLTFWCLSLPTSLLNVYRSYRDGTGNKLPFSEALRPLVSAFILLVFCHLWAVKSPGRMLDTHPRLFFVAAGTTFSNVACRLIVSQMSHTRCDLISSFLYIYVPLVVAIVGFPSIMAPFELLLLRVYTGVVTLLHIVYAYLVVDEMCDHFKIRTFRIDPPNESPSATK